MIHLRPVKSYLKTANQTNNFPFCLSQFGLRFLSFSFFLLLFFLFLILKALTGILALGVDKKLTEQKA